MPTTLVRPLEIADDATRRRFLQLIAAAGLLAGCADDDSPDLPSPTASATPAVRTVRDARGPVDVPLDPQRVVFTDAVPFATALALGFPRDRIAGVALFGDPDYHRPYLGSLADPADFTEISTADGFDFERVVAARPDLIVSITARTENPRFEDIGAPLFVGNVPGNGGLTAAISTFAEIADVLGLSDVGVQAVEELREDIAALGTPDDLPKTALVYLLEDGSFRLGTNTVLDELGIRVGPPTDFFELSAENLVTELETAELILLADFFAGRDEAALLAAAEDSPLWSQVPAVRSGAVTVVDLPTIYEPSLPGIQTAVRTLAGLLQVDGAGASADPSASADAQ